MARVDPGQGEIVPKPLPQTELDLIEHYAGTRFNGDFWRTVNVQRVLRQLIGHIKWQDSRIQGFEDSRGKEVKI